VERRPVGGSSILLMNLGCSPHLKQRGEIGSGRSCFSMARRMPEMTFRQVKVSWLILAAVAPEMKAIH
jgi:hypothetical protein